MSELPVYRIEKHPYCHQSAEYTHPYETRRLNVNVPYFNNREEHRHQEAYRAGNKEISNDVWGIYSVINFFHLITNLKSIFIFSSASFPEKGLRCFDFACDSLSRSHSKTRETSPYYFLIS